MNPRIKERVRELLDRLEELDRSPPPAPHGASIRLISRDAILEELARLTRRPWPGMRHRDDGRGTRRA